MSETLISRNADLARLEAEEEFRLQIIQGAATHLLVENVPAVTTNREVRFGTLYCPLELDAQDQTVKPCANHQCWWIGDPPCDESGRVMEELISNLSSENRGDGIVTSVAFSRKHQGQRPYSDLHDKIWTYIQLIWHPALALDPKCDPRLDKPVPAVVAAQSRIFRYSDMATTRAGIGAATAKLVVDRVAVIGIGGTGSYILDLLAKTPIQQIHLYDGDEFELHNAFRSPGAPAKDQLKNPKKVDWFGNIYDRMHMGIIRHPCHVTAHNVVDLTGFDFVFVAIDDGEARKIILEGLIRLKVPFIDVGIDVAFDGAGSLRGMCRFTVGTPDQNAHIQEIVPFQSLPVDAVYRNIQVADLNMSNASFAVMKWKKMRGFYADDVRDHHSLYTIATHGLTKEDRA